MRHRNCPGLLLTGMRYPRRHTAHTHHACRHHHNNNGHGRYRGLVATVLPRAQLRADGGSERAVQCRHGMARSTRWPRGNHMWGAGLAAPQAQGEHMDGRWQRQVRCLRRAGRRRLWTLDGRARSRSIHGVELSIDDATTALAWERGKRSSRAALRAMGDRQGPTAPLAVVCPCSTTCAAAFHCQT